ncbi:hypothetical protein WMY93_031953 [Mugilogobius chulae]|uniref:Uncharacterized protein n=1 Tax=Mugilogobius chulae TaxID=88201 RepID=A0AAW0MJR6_9GOBI
MTAVHLLVLLLSLLICIPHPGSSLPFNPGNNIGNLFGISDNEKILHRSKRGWMWNQFFLLEEYGGNDHQYVGKIRAGPVTSPVLSREKQDRTAPISPSEPK